LGSNAKRIIRGLQKIDFIIKSVMYVNMKVFEWSKLIGIRNTCCESPKNYDRLVRDANIT